MSKRGEPPCVGNLSGLNAAEVDLAGSFIPAEKVRQGSKWASKWVSQLQKKIKQLNTQPTKAQDGAIDLRWSGSGEERGG